MKDYSPIKRWYSRLDVKYEMLKFTYNRETALLIPSFLQDKQIDVGVRTLRTHNTNHLDYVIKNKLMFEEEKRFNFYYSIAKYKNGIPYGVDREDWKKNHHKEMIGYDFFVDIDAGTHEDIDFALESAELLKKLYDKFSVPYDIRYSGKGFHFIIPHNKIDYNIFEPYTEGNIYENFRVMAKRLQKLISEQIDAKIYDSRRICKIPYSLAIYEDDYFMCCPLQDLQGFNHNNYKVQNVSKLVLRNRGIFMQNPDGNTQQLFKHLRGD